MPIGEEELEKVTVVAALETELRITKQWAMVLNGQSVQLWKKAEELEARLAALTGERG